MPPSSPAVPLDADPSSQPVRDFESTYAAYFHFVWRCLAVLGVPASALEDASQEVFLVVSRRLVEFRGDSDVRTWLYAIARNVAANQRRTQHRRPSAAAPESEPADSAPDPHQRAVEREDAAFVQEFLAGLEDGKRHVFVLALLEGLTIPEVAEILEIPVNTAYTRLRTVRLEFQRAFHGRHQSP